jgi:hypothetical protein
VFCFFAEDVGLLPGAHVRAPGGQQTGARPSACARSWHALFETMRDGGLFGVDDLPWFNGGLFQTMTCRPWPRRPGRAARSQPR